MSYNFINQDISSKGKATHVLDNTIKTANNNILIYYNLVPFKTYYISRSISFSSHIDMLVITSGTCHDHSFTYTEADM